MDELLLRRIRGEFTEMPGLLLTVAQAQRLWHLDEGTCVAALHALVDAHFLMERRNGSYTIAADVQGDGWIPRARSAPMAKVERLPKITRAS